MVAIFYKSFPSVTAKKRELTGYRFLSQYYTNIPALLSDRKQKRLDYEYVRNVGPNCGLLLDEIASNRISDEAFCATLIQLREVFTDTAHTRNGDIVESFYAERLPRLKQVGARHATLSMINSVVIEVPFEEIISYLKDFFGSTREQWVVASQGDFHERNICSDGTLLDFGSAGWNSLAGEFATFLWYNIFAGDYLAPLYHNHKFHDHEAGLSNMTKPVLVRNSASYAVRHERHYLTKTYKEYLIEPILDTIDYPNFSQDCAASIIMRLLTSFPFSTLTRSDRVFLTGCARYLYQEVMLNNKNIFTALAIFQEI